MNPANPNVAVYAVPVKREALAHGGHEVSVQEACHPFILSVLLNHSACLSLFRAFANSGTALIATGGPAPRPASVSD